MRLSAWDTPDRLCRQYSLQGRTGHSFSFADSHANVIRTASTNGVQTAAVHLLMCHWQAECSHFGQHSARHQVLMLGIIEQAGQEVLWAIRLLVSHGLQTSVVPDVPNLQRSRYDCRCHIESRASM